VTSRLLDLVHGDAFDWLANRRAASVHGVVTDPPYTVVEYAPTQLRKKRFGNGGVWRLPQSFDGYERRQVPRFTDLTNSQREDIASLNERLAKALYRVLVPGAHVILASANVLSYLVLNAFISSGFEVRGQIARVMNTFRGGDRPKGAHDKYAEVSVIPRGAWEPWLVFRKPSPLTIAETLGRWGTGALRRPSPILPFTDLVICQRTTGPERELTTHPSQKPQALMRHLVRATLPLGLGVILDPFMGSGSTNAAAMALGIRSIGIERDRRFFDAAVRCVPKLAAVDVGRLSTSIDGRGSTEPSRRTQQRLTRGVATAAKTLRRQR
jgi:DNA modification methylase